MVVFANSFLRRGARGRWAKVTLPKLTPSDVEARTCKICYSELAKGLAWRIKKGTWTLV